MISLINVVGKTGQLYAKESKQTTFSYHMDKDLSIRLEAIKLLKENTEAVCCLNLPSVQETRVQSLGWEDPLEKKVATPSSVLAWGIPWTEEPGEQSMGSQRVRHDRATNTLCSLTSVLAIFFWIGLLR